MLSKRALIWSGVIVATAIAIYITNPAPKPHDIIAMQDEVAKRGEIAKRDEVSRIEKEPATRRPVATTEERSKSLSSDGSWRAPAGEVRKLQDVDKLAKADAGSLRAKMPEENTLDEKKAERRKAAEKKAAPSIEAIAENQPAPAAAPMPALMSPSLAPAAPGRPAPPTTDVTKAAVEPPPPTVVAGNLFAAKRALNFSGTNTYFGGTATGNEPTADGSASAKLGTDRVVAKGGVVLKDTDRVHDRVAKVGELPPLMNGSLAVPGGNLSAAGQMPASNAKSGPTMQYRGMPANRPPLKPTFSMSQSWPYKKVFETLLANQGLRTDRNSSVALEFARR